MRLKAFSLRGLTRFAHPVAVDLDALGGALIALVGPNGAGKTTLLEAAAAALYKALPSRPGSLYEHARGRDAWVEATFEDEAGREIKARVQIDAERRQVESYLFEDGRSLTTGRSVEFEREVEARFGSWELLLASVFAAQNRAGSFLTMPRAGRKALFAELLGLQRLERMHEAARDRKAEAGGSQGAERARLADLEERHQQLDNAEAEASAALARTAEADRTLHNRRGEEAAWNTALERARAQAAELVRQQDAVIVADDAFEAAHKAHEAASLLAGEARAVAERRRRGLAAIDPDAMERRARSRHDVTVDSLRVRRETIERELQGEGALREQAARIEALEAEAVALGNAEKAAAAARSARSLAEQELRAAEQRLKDAQASVEREAARLSEQAGLLGRVPCAASEGWLPAPLSMPRLLPSELAGTCPLLASAREADEKRHILAVPANVEAAVVAAQGRLSGVIAQAEAATLACDPIRAAEAQRELTDAVNAAAKLRALDGRRQHLEGIDADTRRADETLAADLAEAKRRREHVEAETRSLEADLAAALARAAAEVEAATASLRAAEARAQAARAELSKIPILSVEDVEAAVARYRSAREAAEAELREAERAVGVARARCDLRNVIEAQLVERKAALACVELELGDWTILEAALGRDGIQALEIDAAGPEVARLTNELLDACYGPRFRIAFETLREKKSARGEFTESFDVQVLDNGHPRPVEALSGGERVIVGEAVSLALSIFNARRSGIRWTTLFRDETAGALDPVNAAAYVEMLRRALALGGFAQVLFVSHQPEVWERADACVMVADGRVEGGAAPAREALSA